MSRITPDYLYFCISERSAAKCRRRKNHYLSDKRVENQNRIDMKKKLLLTIAAVMLSWGASAQMYDWAVGVRIGGETAGASVKYMLNTDSGFEAILAAPWDDGFTATLLYERHIPIIENGFFLYYGAGGHVGEWKDKFSLGVDGIIGLEYNIPNVPLVLSLDYKPIFNIAERTRFYAADFAFGIKVAF